MPAELRYYRLVRRLHLQDFAIRWRVDDEDDALYTLGPSQCQTNCTLKTIRTGGALTSPGSLVVVDTLEPGSAPSIAPGGVVPVSSSSPIIQAGEWVSIYGTNLASGTATWTGRLKINLF
jgi:hypothetical protein